MEQTPASLLVRLRQPNDAAAWERFIELYTPLLYYWAHRVGLSTADADDLVQEVFLLLVEKLPEFSYDHHKSFRGWLRTVLLNKWRSRQRQNDPIAKGKAVELPELVEPKASSEFWEYEYRQHLVHRVLQLIQAQFQPVTWKAFWEFVVNDRPAQEVAAELDISSNAVYIAKSRVLTRLRTELAGLLE